MSNFKVWIDNPIIGTNTFDSNDFADTSLSRGVGFVAGTAASSKWINSALRQANLVAAAFMDALGSNADGLDLNSSVELVKTRIQNSLSNVVFTQASTRSNLTSGDSLSTQFGKISKWFADLKDLAFLASVGTNKIDNNAITNAKISNNTIGKEKLVSGIINDYDTSKGTIEQRLTNLGFREGVVSFDSRVATPSNIGYTLKRQGNYVLFHLDIVNLSVDFANEPEGYVTDFVLGTLPENFRPNNFLLFNSVVYSGNYVWAGYNTEEVEDLIIVTSIGPDGKIILSFSLSGFRGVVRSINFEQFSLTKYGQYGDIGWEAPPIQN